MKLYLKISLFTLFLFAGFYAKSAFAFTCTAVAGGGNWNSAATWAGSCNSTTPQAGDDVVLDATSGNVVVNVSTANLNSFNMTGYTGTLSSSNNINVVGTAGTTQNVIFDGTITWTGTLILTNNSTALINLTTNGKLIPNLTIAGSATTTLQDNLSFAASKVALLSMGTSVTTKLDMNGFSISGNSTTSRLFIASGTLGTSRTIYLDTGVSGSAAQFAHVDFRDIALNNGGSNLDLSAITGLSGDAGGNTMDGGGSLTLTSTATNYWIGNAGNWDDVAEWASTSGGSASTGRVPLPQDDCTFDNGSFNGSSQTITTNGMPRLCRNMDWSAYTEAQSPNLTLSNTTLSVSVFGSINIANGGTSVIGTWNQGGTLFFAGRGSSTLTTGGETFGAVTVSMLGGSLTIQDALTSSGVVSLTNGTFDANDFNITAPTISATGSATKVINAGNGTWTATGTGTNPFQMATAGNGLTFNAEGSTIILSGGGAGVKQFTGAGQTYNIATFQGDNNTLINSNTFATINAQSPGGANGLRFTGNTTTTITTSFTVNATSTAARQIATSTTGSLFVLNYTGVGTVCVDYVNLSRSVGSPGSTWYAGANSLDSGNNSGWTFSACPAPGSSSTPMIIRFD